MLLEYEQMNESKDTKFCYGPHICPWTNLVIRDSFGASTLITMRHAKNNKS